MPADLWTIVEAARAEGDEPYVVADRVRKQLAQLPAAEIYSYLEQQAELMKRSYTWALWGAAYVANGGCSDDGFDYFRGWLIAQGKDAFERVLADPDALAELVDEPDEADCEDMIGAATLAYKDVTGDYPRGPRIQLPALGPSWDFDDEAEMRKRYPRLWEKLVDIELDPEDA
jgi:hypothetical protein